MSHAGKSKLDDKELADGDFKDSCVKIIREGANLNEITSGLKGLRETFAKTESLESQQCYYAIDKLLSFVVGKSTLNDLQNYSLETRVSSIIHSAKIALENKEQFYDALISTGDTELIDKMLNLEAKPGVKLYVTRNFVKMFTSNAAAKEADEVFVPPPPVLDGFDLDSIPPPAQFSNPTPSALLPKAKVEPLKASEIEVKANDSIALLHAPSVQLPKAKVEPLKASEIEVRVKDSVAIFDASELVFPGVPREFRDALEELRLERSIDELISSSQMPKELAFPPDASSDSSVPTISGEEDESSLQKLSEVAAAEHLLTLIPPLNEEVNDGIEELMTRATARPEDDSESIDAGAILPPADFSNPTSSAQLPKAKVEPLDASEIEVKLNDSVAALHAPSAQLPKAKVEPLDASEIGVKANDSVAALHTPSAQLPKAKVESLDASEIEVKLNDSVAALHAPSAQLPKAKVESLKASEIEVKANDSITALHAPSAQLPKAKVEPLDASEIGVKSNDSVTALHTPSMHVVEADASSPAARIGQEDQSYAHRVFSILSTLIQRDGIGEGIKQQMITLLQNGEDIRYEALDLAGKDAMGVRVLNVLSGLLKGGGVEYAIKQQMITLLQGDSEEAGLVAADSPHKSHERVARKTWDKSRAETPFESGSLEVFGDVLGTIRGINGSLNVLSEADADDDYIGEYIDDSAEMDALSGAIMFAKGVEETNPKYVEDVTLFLPILGDNYQHDMGDKAISLCVKEFIEAVRIQDVEAILEIVSRFDPNLKFSAEWVTEVLQNSEAYESDSDDCSSSHDGDVDSDDAQSESGSMNDSGVSEMGDTSPLPLNSPYYWGQSPIGHSNADSEVRMFRGKCDLPGSKKPYHHVSAKVDTGLTKCPYIFPVSGVGIAPLGASSGYDDFSDDGSSY